MALHGHIYPILRFKHHLVGDPTLWLFNIAMENGPFIDDFPIKTSIYKGFSMAMLVITRWYPIKLYPVIDSNTFKYPMLVYSKNFQAVSTKLLSVLDSLMMLRLVDVYHW